MKESHLLLVALVGLISRTGCSLYTRLDGTSAITSVVDDFAATVAAGSRIYGFRTFRLF